VCWSIVVKEKPTVATPLFGAFPYEQIPKAAKDVKCIFFKIRVAKNINYSSECQELYVATTYYF
jgi:hypothetical protein